jgi:ubiquinone/menaquinone biosynthesis C-methylase UbiE
MEEPAMTQLTSPATVPTSAASTTALERVRAIYDRRAKGYDRRVRLMERLVWGDRRSRVCALATGDVLELAVGTGLNFPYYPKDIRLTGVELSPGMLAIARARAARLGLAADLRLGDVQALEFPDERFDTVVCTLSLCTIPDAQRALAEARRVLRPGGRLLLLEHVRSPRPIVRFVEQLLDPLAVRFMGDHLLRDPLDHLGALGFTVERVDRAKRGLLEWVVARKPAP